MSMYKTPVSPDELYHYGVMGMHWGIRRYQPYPDGSHKGREVGQAAKVEKRKKKSNAGKIEKRKRLGKAVAKGAAVAGVAAAGAFGAAAGLSNAKRKSGVYLDQNIKQGKGKADASPAEIITKETDKSVNKASESARRLSNMSKRSQAAKQRLEADAKVKRMSDDDLRQVINRLNLEKQYKSLTTAEIESGWDKAADVLDVVGGITGVAASAAVIGATLYGIKTGRGIRIVR